LSKFDPTTKFITGTESMTINAEQQGKKKYEIRVEAASSYQVEVPDKTRVEIQHERTYLDLIRDVLAAATLADERYVHRGVKHLVSFYEQYRVILPPDSLEWR